MSVIKDGSSGNTAKVDKSNRVHVGAVARTEKDAAIAAGRFFIFSTEVVILTDSTETPVFYIQNNDDRPMYLDLFISTMGPSTGGSTPIKMRSYVGLTEASGIVSAARPALAGNANATSSAQFNGDAFKGAPGDFIEAAAINFVTFILDEKEKLQVQTSAILPKGGNTMYSYEAPPGNTDMEVSIIFGAYYVDEELPD